eukprot:tig00001537_g9304.t1
MGGRCWYQLFVLLSKNARLARLRVLSTLAPPLLALVVCAGLLGLQRLADSRIKLADDELHVHPPRIPIPAFGRSLLQCGDALCKILGWAPPVPWARRIVLSIAAEAGLDPDADLIAFASSDTMLDYVMEESPTILAGVAFDVQGLRSPATAAIPSDVSYTLFYNSSGVARVDPSPYAFKQALDNAILRERARDEGRPALSVAFDLKPFPHVPNRDVADIDVISTQAPLWLFLPMCAVFISGVLFEVVHEKEVELRTAIRAAGVPAWAITLAWFVTGVAHSAAATLAILAAGHALAFDLFTNAPALLHAALFLAFGVAMTSLALVISALASRTSQAQSAAYAAVIGGLVLQALFASPDVVRFLFLEDAPFAFALMRGFCYLYAPFHFAKVLGSIALHAGRHFEPRDWRWLPGPGYGWGQLVWRQRGDLFPFSPLEPGSYDVPSDAASLIALPALAAAYLLIALALDGEWPLREWARSAAEGARRAAGLLRLVGQAAGLGAAEAKLAGELAPAAPFPATPAATENGSVSCISTREHLSASAALVPRPCQASRGGRGIAQDTAVEALRDFSMSAARGEILALLGQNGAGKSTLCALCGAGGAAGSGRDGHARQARVLAGLRRPSGGEAFLALDGRRLPLASPAARPLVGFCPQHDVFWPELTAAETLAIFCRLRGVPLGPREDPVGPLLASLGLLYAADTPVGAFSGGMRRRLSVAVGCVGDPALLLLDEPTAGLDPVARRGLLSDAEAAADRLLLLARGRLRPAPAPPAPACAPADATGCRWAGDGPGLRACFGAGYSVSVAVDSPDGRGRRSGAGRGGAVVRVPAWDAALLDFADWAAGRPLAWSLQHAPIDEALYEED